MSFQYWLGQPCGKPIKLTQICASPCKQATPWKDCPNDSSFRWCPRASAPDKNTENTNMKTPWCAARSMGWCLVPLGMSQKEKHLKPVVSPLRSVGGSWGPRFFMVDIMKYLVCHLPQASVMVSQPYWMSFEAWDTKPHHNILPLLWKAMRKKYHSPQPPRTVLKKERSAYYTHKTVFKSIHVMFECNFKKSCSKNYISASIFAFETHTPGQCR